MDSHRLNRTIVWFPRSTPCVSLSGGAVMQPHARHPPQHKRAHRLPHQAPCGSNLISSPSSLLLIIPSHRFHPIPSVLPVRISIYLLASFLCATKSGLLLVDCICDVSAYRCGCRVLPPSLFYLSSLIPSGIRGSSRIPSTHPAIPNPTTYELCFLFLFFPFFILFLKKYYLLHTTIVVTRAGPFFVLLSPPWLPLPLPLPAAIHY